MSVLPKSSTYSDLGVVAPLLFTDLFLEFKSSAHFFLIRFATPFFSSATVEAIEADEGKLASPLSVGATTDKGSAGCIHFAVACTDCVGVGLTIVARY